MSVEPVIIDLINTSIPNFHSLSQPRYACVENCYYKNILEHYNDYIIIELLDNKTPKEELDNIMYWFFQGYKITR